ncbi:hypothetical protein [Pseudoruegeria sp. HB172150]|uniref:hypothetical protein n=1 Tax=Pseudoruegeria sp. HB172150 TaxID=2721164 RepID=UPI00155625E0|nr:hypothetical protein [Pseudoruegeria sp. HB172150]
MSPDDLYVRRDDVARALNVRGANVGFVAKVLALCNCRFVVGKQGRKYFYLSDAQRTMDRVFPEWDSDNQAALIAMAAPIPEADR